MWHFVKAKKLIWKLLADVNLFTRTMQLLTTVTTDPILPAPPSWFSHSQSGPKKELSWIFRCWDISFTTPKNLLLVLYSICRYNKLFIVKWRNLHKLNQSQLFGSLRTSSEKTIPGVKILFYMNLLPINLGIGKLAQICRLC